jgi:hypothetical protein
MAPPNRAAPAYVLVIDRRVYRRVPEADIEALAAAMEANLEYVSFRTEGVTVQAYITGVSVGWAEERERTL